MLRADNCFTLFISKVNAAEGPRLNLEKWYQTPYCIDKISD